MTSGQWQQVERIFAIASECDRAGRAGLLDRECGQDAELRREVESLLEAEPNAGQLDRLAMQVAPAIGQLRRQTIGWEGHTVGRYHVLEPCGSGAMGVVYKALDERLGRHVALKFLSPHLTGRADGARRLLREARAAAALDHPNICTIHEVGEADDGHLFIAMPLYAGETLEQRLRRGPLGYAEAIAITRQIASALAHAHHHGIVHRDIKPANVMLLADDTVKVLDFGVARREEATVTDAEGTPGTLAYMSPEQLHGETADQRADVWSLGVVLYEMVTGARPFRGESRADVRRAILTRDPEPITRWRPNLPLALDALLQRTLARSPEARCPSAAALVADLDDLDKLDELSGANGASEPLRDAAAPAADGERRWVAVLVTTLSGFETLVEQLPAADLDHAIAELHEVAATVAQRHGGVLNQAIGGEVVLVFGVPVAHDDDARRAVTAGMELRQAVAAMQMQDAPLAVQSGVHVGHVVAHPLIDGPGRYRLTGATVQIASRLSSLAGADDLLVSAACRGLIAPWIDVDPEPAAAAMDAFRVRGEPASQPRVDAARLTPYSGREGELTTLESQLAQACTGQGRVTIVLGEAGAGKSRLLHELRAHVASDMAVRIVQGRCRPPGSSSPYLPFVEILREVAGAGDGRSGDANEIAARLLAIDPTLAPFVPLYLHLLSLTSPQHPLPRHLAGEHLRTALLESLTALVAALARHTPTLMLLEDWHWVDAASREVLRRLADIASTQALLIIVTCRPEAGPLAECGEDAMRLPLAPLGRGPATAIMRALLGVERLSEALVRQIHARTGGNAFFLEQVCHTLLEVPGDHAVPDTVQAVIRARFDRLDRQAVDVLRVAAVIGPEFEQQLIAEVLGPHVDLTRAFARLKASGLIQQIQQTSTLPGPAYRFRHVLTQEVAYDSLLVRQRRSWHERVGLALERQHREGRDDDAEQLAHHFSHAERWNDAIRHGLRAGAHAARLSQFTEALAIFDRVREWMRHQRHQQPAADALADLLLQQERLSETLGLRSQQQSIIDELIAALAPGGPSARLAQTYLRQGDLATLLTRFGDAERALDTARRLSRELGESRLESHALRSLGLLRWHEGRYAQALPIAEEALAIDRAAGDDLAVAGDLTNIAAILKSMGEHARALAVLDEALAIPALRDDPAKELHVLHTVANVHRELGDPDAALRWLQRADDIAVANLLLVPRSFHLLAIAHLHLQQGQLDEALRIYREAVALCQRVQLADGLAQAQRALGEVLFVLGRDDEALPCVEEAARLFAQLQDLPAEADMCGRLAIQLETRGTREAAADEYAKLASLRRTFGDGAGELEAVEGLARLTRQRQGVSPSEAMAAYRVALDLALATGDRRRQATLHNTMGILAWQAGCYGDALRHYEQALERVRELGDRKHEGLLLNSVGVTLHRLGRLDEARAVVEESVDVNRATGERLFEAHALTVLGDIWCAGDRPDLAMDCFEQSRLLREALGDEVGAHAMTDRLCHVI